MFLATNDDILIADPEAEYYPLVQRLGGQVIKISPTSRQYVNPMDLNLDYSDDESPLSLKVDFLLSFCDIVVGSKDGLQPIEKTVNGFFDFTEKYTLKTSAIHVPARISPAKTAEMKEAAQRIYKALGCQGFARVDMFLDKAGRVVFNEVNTIPGFTAHSRYPSMMKAVGMSFEQVISNVIELAVNG